ncbi:hypothetical protein BO86DRAFT_13267 [Aspergillus japonicus CBS 114.51]|uniref:Uncharacterized protein n=1 Tax=Aspergillus japonicus CBS 114.51 TaxID=1448312 RepID=A0A8T8X7V3_ASPJA|nr:hypothetical protein BO86DRAFT_13267 [Aspergillus japonicus CBS 114.51]RAH84131.1 hypothetical protein BO86DRAFT_13267 [Aspergillus japonicus CBS 114.51]
MPVPINRRDGSWRAGICPRTQVSDYMPWRSPFSVQYFFSSYPALDWQRKIHDRIPSCLMVVCCLGIRRLLGHLLLCDAWVILAMFCAGVFGSIAPLRRGDAQPSAARSVSNSQSRWKIRVSQPKIGG